MTVEVWVNNKLFHAQVVTKETMAATANSLYDFFHIGRLLAVDVPAEIRIENVPSAMNTNVLNKDAFISQN